MQVQEFNIGFTFKGRRVEASCQRFKPQEETMVRVLVENGEQYGQLFMFYEWESEGKIGLFAFTPSGFDTQLATAIAKRLKRESVLFT